VVHFKRVVIYFSFDTSFVKTNNLLKVINENIWAFQN